MLKTAVLFNIFVETVIYIFKDFLFPFFDAQKVKKQHSFVIVSFQFEILSLLINCISSC